MINRIVFTENENVLLYVLKVGQASNTNIVIYSTPKFMDYYKFLF